MILRLKILWLEVIIFGRYVNSQRNFSFEKLICEKCMISNLNMVPGQ
jgi:hypothetical protein